MMYGCQLSPDQYGSKLGEVCTQSGRVVTGPVTGGTGVRPGAGTGDEGDPSKHGGTGCRQVWG